MSEPDHPYDTIAVATWAERLTENPAKLTAPERRALVRDLLDAIAEIERLRGDD